MDVVIIVSVCERMCKDYALFHFKGFYKGKEIKKVIVTSKRNLFKKGSEYLLCCQVERIEGFTLFVHEVKSKRIEEVEWH